MRTAPWPALALARGIAVFALCLILATPALALEASDIEEVELDNGARVLLWHDDTIPNLAIYTLWKVGSRNEAPGITGLAHFFEHMMFNGSENYPPGEFDRTMEAAGGANNAYTSANVTVYQDWVPASALEVTLDLEADRIRALSVDPEVVDSERGVVMSERRRSVEELRIVELHRADGQKQRRLRRRLERLGSDLTQGTSEGGRLGGVLSQREDVGQASR